MKGYTGMFVGLFILGAAFVILAVVPLLERIGAAIDGLTP